MYLFTQIYSVTHQGRKERDRRTDIETDGKRQTETKTGRDRDRNRDEEKKQ